MSSSFTNPAQKISKNLNTIIRDFVQLRTFCFRKAINIIY